MNRACPALLVLLGPVLVTACGGGDKVASGSGSASTAADKPSAPISAAARAEARSAFDTICTSCHGNVGKGDGPAAAAMDPKPRSFGDKSWQDSVTDEHIIKVITLGGAAVGKSPVMVAQPQFKAKPEVLRGLVEIIRAFGK
ncbi:MAG: hypothetical protein R3F56_12120 [Planctomycetota bacterium]